MILDALQTLIRTMHGYALTDGYYRLSPDELDNLVALVYAHGVVVGRNEILESLEATHVTH